MACIRFSGRHTSSNIAANFERVVSKFDLTGKVDFITSNNVSIFNFNSIIIFIAIILTLISILISSYIICEEIPEAWVVNPSVFYTKTLMFLEKFFLAR